MTVNAQRAAVVNYNFRGIQGRWPAYRHRRIAVIHGKLGNYNGMREVRCSGCRLPKGLDSGPAAPTFGTHGTPGRLPDQCRRRPQSCHNGSLPTAWNKENRVTFMRNLFGPSTQEIWRQLCAEIGAQYVEGGFWKGDKVQAAHGPWTITLDTYTVSTGKSRSE